MGGSPRRPSETTEPDVGPRIVLPADRGVCVVGAGFDDAEPTERPAREERLTAPDVAPPISARRAFADLAHTEPFSEHGEPPPRATWDVEPPGTPAEMDESLALDPFDDRPVHDTWRQGNAKG